MEKQKFLSMRDQFVDGKAVAEGQTVEVEPDRVRYLTANGWLKPMEADAKPARKKANKQAEQVEPTEPTEPTDQAEQTEEGTE